VSQSKFRTHYDAVIVGGGHNGLVAAAYLARADQSVLLLERNAELGGATASQRIFPGMDARLSRYSYLISLLPQQIIAVANPLGIAVHYHIIVGKQGHASLKGLKLI